MKIQITKQECIWIADLVRKEKERATKANREMPNRIFELRRDNMADLEAKLNGVIQKERNDMR